MINNYNLSTKYIGRNMLTFNTIDSTNEFCKKTYKNYPNGTVIISKIQTLGKGKGERKWISNDGGIYLSILLKPASDIINNMNKIPLLTSVIICEALKGFNINCKIKWPNDIIINNKKLGGILTESKISSIGVEYVIVGIGLNINSSLPNDSSIQNKFISLKEIFKCEFNNQHIIENILNKFEILWEDFLIQSFHQYLNLYKSYCLILNSKVKLIGNKTEEIVTVLDILEDGTLLVLDTNNIEKQIYSGDISLRGLNGYI